MTRAPVLASGLPVLAILLAALAVWAMTVGASEISPGEVAHALWARAGGRVDLVVAEVRLPRVLAGIAVGASLAAAGAIMQAVTRNPLADPGLLGVNAGAAFAVVIALAFFDVTAAGTLIWAAFAGAAAAALLVFSLGSAGRSGATPIKLVLAGVVVATFLGALTMSVLVLDAQTFDAVRLWTAGSLRGRQLSELLALLPYAAIALLAALSARAQFTLLSLGDDMARGLGQNLAIWRAVAAVLVVALAGSAVAIAGPLAFVGLAAPHLARLAVGADYRWVLPYAILCGAGLTLLADTLPRALLSRDVPVGVTLALIGAPLLVWLARARVERG